MLTLEVLQRFTEEDLEKATPDCLEDFLGKACGCRENYPSWFFTMMEVHATAIARALVSDHSQLESASAMTTLAPLILGWNLAELYYSVGKVDADEV